MLPAWLNRLQRTGLLLMAGLYSMGYGTWGLFLLLVTAMLEGIVTRRVPWPRSKVDPLVAAFLAILLTSGYLSPYRPIALGSTGLAALMIYLAFGVSMSALRRDLGVLKPLIAAWVTGGVAAALWGLLVYRRTGLDALTPELGRNALGTTLLIAFLLCLGLVLDVRTSWRFLAAPACIVLLAGLLATHTRGAWLGAASGILILMVLSGVRKSLPGIVVVFLVIVAGIALPGSVREAVVRRASTIPDVAANQDRVILLQTSLRIVADHPVVGTGLNTFAAVYPQYRLPGDPNPLPLPFAHNIFVNMAVEGGILGLAAFAGILAQGISAGWVWHRAKRDNAGTVPAAVILSALIGAMVHQLFDGTLISIHLGLGMWILLAVLSAGRMGSTAARAASVWTSA